MARYVTSDWHLGHERIIELCGRPFTSVDEMNEAILDNLNSTVNPDDELIILGDIVMGSLAVNMPLLSQVRCRKVFLHPGNHDRWSLAYPAKGDIEAKRRVWASRYESQAPDGSEWAALPDRIPSVWRYKIADYYVWASHYPYEGDSHNEDRHPELRPRDRDGFLINGHVHTSWTSFGRQFNVGVDVHDFSPVHEDEVRAWIDDTIVHMPDDEVRDASVQDLQLPHGTRHPVEV